jgi:hypothetical protein
MIFTRAVPVLLIAAVSSKALYIPDALYTRELEEASEFAERGLDHLNNVGRDLASNNEVTVLTARDFVTLGLRSEDVRSQILVTRERPSRGPYECRKKADCQKHIEYADHQIQEAKSTVVKWRRVLKAAARRSAAYRTAKNNLHTARESLAGWEEYKEDYRRIKSRFAS